METNRQNYMMDNNMQHLNVAGAGDGVVGGVQSEVVSGVAAEILGGKYDEHHEEHDVGDDDELKYVKEEQQSEKQQQQQIQTLKNFGLDGDDDDGTYESNELAEKETTNAAGHGFGNGNGGFVFGGNHEIHSQQQHHDLFNIGNGHDTNGHAVNTIEGFDNIISTGFEEKLNMMDSELDSFKIEGDFYSTNVTEGDDSVPQIDVKIEASVEHHEMVDEEEPSSLATNTTNGTSSLSENVPQQVVVAPQTNAFDDVMANFEDKENSDPLTPQRPNDLDLDQAHSQLNPDAKEFIPSFGSNPASPTSPLTTAMPPSESALNDIVETQMYFGQASSAVPQYLLSDDDFVAQSPCKGKGDNNMDTVSLPILSEFEQEADKRPHELEPEGIDIFHQRDEVMTPDQAIQQLPLDDLVTQKTEKEPSSDSADFQPLNFNDHGPETCVDLEADLDIQPSLQCDDQDDVMNRSMYVTNEEVIEDVLNSVQPIPTEIESINNSFIVESAENQLAGDKELLQIEEKEHVSHSPSTEEIQMNLQNTLNSSNKDIPQLPIDMDDANNMQESIYMEHEQSVQQDPKREEGGVEKILFQQTAQSETDVYQFQEQEQEQYQEEIHNFQGRLEHDFQVDEHDFEKQPHEQQLLVEKPQKKTNELDYGQQLNQDVITEAAEETNVSFLDNVLETQELQQEIIESCSPFKTTNEVSNTPAIESFNLDATANEQEITQSEQETTQSDFITPPLAADEKNLVEESKNQEPISDLELQMSEITLNNPDSCLSQAEKIVTTTATIAMEDISENLITSDEAVVQEDHKENPEQMLVDDSFSQHEEECIQQHQQELRQQEMDIELKQQTEIKPDIVQEYIESPMEQQHQQELQSEMVVVEESIIEAKQATPLFTSEETEIVTKTEERQEISSFMIPETHPVELIETSQAAPFFTNEETEIEAKTEEIQEISSFMIPETNPVELLEPHMTKSEIEIFKSVEEPLEPQSTDEVKTETITEPDIDIELKTNEENIIKEEVTPNIPVEAVIAAATAAVATTVAVAAKEVSSPSKNKGETVKKSLSKTTTAAKPKLTSTTAAKKPVEVAKKTVGLAAKPRTAAAKPATTTTDKKPIGRTAATATTTTARKPLSATTTASLKVVAKTTSSTSSTRMATAPSKTTTTSKPTTAPRTVSSSTTTARKPATTNGPLAKQRPGSAPAKPTTLGLSATNGAPKAKPTSPRETLISHVRKANSATTGAKSPIKSSATNGVTKTASSTLASRTKTTTSTSTVSNIAGTAVKTFTARPAPKFTSTTTTTTTTRRSTGGGSATASTTTTSTKTASTPLRKSSPTKPATGRTPTKSANTGGGSKSKTPITKPASSSHTGKPAPIRKPVDNTAVVTNGEADANKILTSTGEKIAAQEQHQQASTENGDLQTVQLEQQNGDSTIPIQTEKQQQQSFLEPRDEQIPMDLINA